MMAQQWGYLVGNSYLGILEGMAIWIFLREQPWGFIWGDSYWVIFRGHKNLDILIGHCDWDIVSATGIFLMAQVELLSRCLTFVSWCLKEDSFWWSVLVTLEDLLNRFIKIHYVFSRIQLATGKSEMRYLLQPQDQRIQQTKMKKGQLLG